jgi:pimeloyl-[acyl-carrier protein] methyl ester esterase
MSLYHTRTGSGPDLVLVHGWGMNAAVWEPLLPTLSRRFRLTIVELPGHGASPPAAAADLAEWARLVSVVAPAGAWWLGWSLGGHIAMQAALDSPERVAGLALVAATPRFVQAADWPCAMPVKTFHQFADALAADANATLARFLALQVSGADHARDTLKLLRAELLERPPASAKGLQQGLDLLLNVDLRDHLPSLRCPVHWLLGERDTLVPLVLCEALAQYLPAASIDVIRGAGHAPFLSHPQASLDLLLQRVGER